MDMFNYSNEERMLKKSYAITVFFVLFLLSVFYLVGF